MGFRVVMIENEVTINLKLNNMVIKKMDEEIWIPLDDISVIILDNLNVMISGRMLSILATNNIMVVICNNEHLPIGMYSSYDSHSRVSKCIGYQIEKEQEYYDLLWQDIVRCKIDNQRKVLARLNIKEDVQGNMSSLSEQIVSGDKTNREAHAAKIYFNALMNTSFSRGNENILLNSGLDYGYTIIRSFIARACVGYGLNTQLGIHHKNEYNRFNLVDDLMEVVRPMVDYYSYELLENEEYFTANHRRKLVNMLNHRYVYNSKKMYVCNMLENYVEQYAALLQGKREKICFPDFEGYIGEEDEV